MTNPVNPARSTGPAPRNGGWAVAQLWLFKWRRFWAEHSAAFFTAGSRLYRSMNLTYARSRPAGKATAFVEPANPAELTWSINSCTSLSTASPGIAVASACASVHNS